MYSPQADIGRPIATLLAFPSIDGPWTVRQQGDGVATVRPDYRSVIIENCRPTVDAGAFDAKACAGVPMRVSADVFAHGHDHVVAWVRWGTPRLHGTPAQTLPRSWREQMLDHPGGDHFTTWITPTGVGHLAFEIVGAVDDFGGWLVDLKARLAAGQDVTLELEVGASLCSDRAQLPHVAARDRASLRSLAFQLRHDNVPVSRRIEAASTTRVRRLMDRTLDRNNATVAGPFLVWVDGDLAGFSAWYEMFPRSEGAKPPRGGTLRTAARRLPDIAAMGFDVVYLPPIHPIGSTHRKGANNTEEATRDDVGSPWAIGSAAGGHTAVDPNLGSLADFDGFVVAARAAGLTVALDFALQCSPDHPWVLEHPEWFAHRPDGSIRYAGNPPKKYQDIYPLDFTCRDKQGLWNAARDVVLFWCDRGVRIFRVDNPHTKPLRFWEWLIAQIRRRHPDAIFLAEAFTRPIVMQHLAKVGFTQSYTYFTWRNSKAELAEYFGQLATPPSVDYFRPNFWTNTPDILHATLQQGGPAAFRLRLVLAALGAASWGMYSGYELCENTPVAPGSEEYLHSEKYELRPRDWSRPDSLAPLIGRVNEIRRRHRAAVSQLATLRVHHVDNDALFCFSRSQPDNSDVLLVIVNLNPHGAESGTTWIDLAALGIDTDIAFEAHDEVTDTTYIWQGPCNFVHLDPTHQPAHILHLRKR